MAEVPVTLLRCPVTHGPLQHLGEPGVGLLNERIAGGDCRRCDGGRVDEPVREALVSADGAFAYRIDDGIISLLAETALVMTDAAPSETHASGRRAEKDSVRAFYDEVGWQAGDDTEFVDTARFVAAPPVLLDYHHSVTQRIGRQIPGSGDYLLDVGSGPVQFPEYREYQAGYGARICVDLSRLALREARERIGPEGVLIQGDITNLPFRDGAIDCAVCLHVIYHVPRDEQPKAFRELHRVIKLGGRAVIAYSWGHTPWGELSAPRKLLHLPVRLVRRARRELQQRRPSPAGAVPGAAAAAEPELYFHAYDHHWFVRQPWPFRAEILGNHSFRSALVARFARERLFGRRLLALLTRYEDRFPHVAGRLGRYPLIVIDKEQEAGSRGS